MVDVLWALVLAAVFIALSVVLMRWGRRRSPRVYPGSPAHRAGLARVDLRIGVHRAVIAEAETVLAAAHHRYGALYEPPARTTPRP